MNCNDMQYLIHAYIDNELDMAKCIEVEQHLNECSKCSTAYSNYLELHNKLRTQDLYFAAPEDLLDKINSSINPTGLGSPITIRNKFFNRYNISLGIAAAIIIFLSIIIIRSNSLNNNYMEEYILSNHLRSLALNSEEIKTGSDINGTSRLTDVTSTDEHTVKPWFDGKLDFSPPVIDLKDKGFQLIGGRLDYIKNQPAAALVYKYKKHIINMFVTLSDKSLSANSGDSRLRGFNLISWNKSGMNYWVISDLNSEQLLVFSNLIKESI